MANQIYTPFKVKIKEVKESFFIGSTIKFKKFPDKFFHEAFEITVNKNITSQQIQLTNKEGVTMCYSTTN